MFVQTAKKHHLARFDSLAEFTGYSRGLPDHRSKAMRRDGGRGSYYGDATSMAKLHDLADKGMAREGIKALALADEKIQSVMRELDDMAYHTVWDVAGADVDVPRYLAGEQENMMDYWSNPEAASQPVVTLVVNVAVHCGISAEAFRTHGAALVALAEAIDGVGLQSEIWADFTITGGYGSKAASGYTGRFSIRLKSGNGPFDSGAFMFTLTHPAMFRGMVLNAMHDWPEAWRDACHVGGTYGYPTSEYLHPEDYPEGAIYVPAMQSNRDAGEFLNGALRQLGLLADA